MSYQYQQPIYYQPQQQQQQYYPQPYQQPQYYETQAERVSRLRGQGHLVFAAFLSLAATVSLTLVTFSSPFLPSIHFLHSQNRKFGAFGYCPTWDLTRPDDCWGPVLGYEWQPWIPGGWLVKIMILYGIAMVSLFPAFLSHHSAAHMRNHGAIFRLFAIPAALSSMLAFGFSTYLFGKALSDFNNSDVPDTGFGPALWISLGGTIAAVLSLLVGGPRDQIDANGFGDSATTRNVATGDAGGGVPNSGRKRGRFKRADATQVYEI
ncbi:hypothetical protein BDY24DRAFT_438415 [Mrakia frigida]|uniref:uncharacterized protein n=1 Tax=Mrakia frigida TaxID=29902 RepID=UPI003FCC10AF